MDDQITVTLISPAKIAGKIEAAGSTVTVDALTHSHLVAAGAVAAEEAVAVATNGDADLQDERDRAIQERDAALRENTELADAYQELSDEFSTLKAERDALAEKLKEAEGKVSELLAQAQALNTPEAAATDEQDGTAVPQQQVEEPEPAKPAGKTTAKRKG